MTDQLDLDAIESRAREESHEGPPRYAHVGGVGATPDETLALVARVRAAEAVIRALVEAVEDCRAAGKAARRADAPQGD